MSISELTQKEAVEQETMAEKIAPLLEPDAATLGTDEQGAEHNVYRPADVVVVYDGRDLDQIVRLQGRTLQAYVRNVAKKRGWRLPGQLADAVIAADRRAKTEGR